MVKRITKAQLEKAEADRFREIVASLLHIRHPDWTDWEWDWLHDEARRPPDYIYTEAEDRILDRLIVYSKSFSEYAGYTVPELIAIAYPYRFDLNEAEQVFVENLHAWGATELKRRQIQQLAGICRRCEDIGRDLLKEAA
ncbi:MAG: hypothetical protein ACXWKS_04440 [Rhizomicrobium sp.]